MKKLLIIMVLCYAAFLGAEGTLFVGLEGSSPVTYQSNMEGFPEIEWNTLFSMDVSGAAATPDGRIYLCEGAFTTHLYEASLTINPQQICTIANDMSALAYGRDTLWGYSNYATPLGIYSIDTETGATELALGVAPYRFFALDYNPDDDLFYGYTEYGASGLYSINIDTGEMIQLAGSIPATNGQGRGMAVGDNTVFLTATRGDDGIPYFAYDISQGAGGEWVEFPNPYPAYHSTGGAAWIAAPDENVIIQGHVVSSDFPETGEPDCLVTLEGQTDYETETDENGDFIFAEVAYNANYDLEINKDGFDLYTDDITVGIEDIDLGTIILQETPYPAENVTAIETVQYEEVTVSWDDPDLRMLEGYIVYRFLECFSGNPELWDVLIEDTFDNEYIDTGWAELPANLWQYAVIAHYTSGIYSEPAFSDPIEKIVTGSTENNIPVQICEIQSIYPNPFNPAVTIAYHIAEAAYVEVNIYNLKGQLVKQLDSEEFQSGEHQINWLGVDQYGNIQPSGVYLVNISINGIVNQTAKVLLLK
ncbi:MAG: T9SS type A sorting domain-containing protein [Candidatus Cloacimonetes bacterium]|nr:T9SS type A sorting domain-containing protein [Candidatus Cloacimonadota bacterium]